MLSRDILRTDLNLLVVFATIYQEESITKAADTLHVSQPAVSASLNRLREQFSDPLFVRSRNGVTPTNLAETLIGPIREGLQSLNLAFKEAEAFDPATSQRTISVSMGDLAEVLFLTPLVSKLHSLKSAMTVRNLMAPSTEVHSKLATGEIDFAVEFFNINETNLSRRLLLRDEFVCVFRKGHPALEKRWNLKTFLSQDHMHISNRPGGEGVVDGALSAIKETRRISVRVQHCLVAFQMLKKVTCALQFRVNLSTDASAQKASKSGPRHSVSQILSSGSTGTTSASIPRLTNGSGNYFSTAWDPERKTRMLSC